ncbi:hypothetical protein [Phaeovulum sp. NW3]|uniref:hypothetical protein n=1 Tax=Phaeovulum sp. NW3 TaxID=2934933 RepID=UPI0020204DCE|nr:hypothetical protein [Phaeovulum sp. NW3]MCL7465516.1 hypothetical protein [Phaeovulum sp. NW3]
MIAVTVRNADSMVIGLHSGGFEAGALRTPALNFCSNKSRANGAEPVGHDSFSSARRSPALFHRFRHRPGRRRLQPGVSTYLKFTAEAPNEPSADLVLEIAPNVGGPRAACSPTTQKTEQRRCNAV